MTDTRADIATRRHSFTPITEPGFDVELPELVQELLFGKTGDSATAVPGCFALLDGTRTPFLEERVADQSLNALCLFSNKNSDIDLKDAPWLIELRPDAALTLDLFSHTDLPMSLWPARPGVILRTCATADVLRAHFRKFTYLRKDTGERVLFRFWEPYVAYGLASVAQAQYATVFAPALRVICPLDRRSLGVIDAPPGPDGQPAMPMDKTLRDRLSFLRAKNTFVEIAERLWARAPKDDADWPAFRNETIGRGEAWMKAYDLTTRKYIETLLMYHAELPDVFADETTLHETDAILRTPGTQGERMQALTQYLKAKTA